MNPLLLVSTVIVLLMATRLVDIFGRGRYVCPHCGTRSARGHSSECPWNHTGSA